MPIREIDYDPFAEQYVREQELAKKRNILEIDYDPFAGTEEEHPAAAPSKREALQPPASKVGTLGGVASALGQGVAEGVTTAIPEMVGESLEFVGSYLPGQAVESIGKDLKEWAEAKGKSLYGEPKKREGLERWVYEGSKMLAPSVIPAGVVGTGVRILTGVGKLVKAGKAAELAGDVARAKEYYDAATKAAKLSNNVASASTAGLFGTAQAQSTRDNAELQAKKLEAAGDFEGARQAREAGQGWAPIASGAIEAGGEFFGTKYLGKLFRLDEAGVAKRGAKELVRDFLKTLGVEVGTEMGQQGGEAGVEKASGIRPEADPLAEALDVIGPTAFMTLLTGGAAGAVNRMRRDPSDSIDLMEEEKDQPDLTEPIKKAIEKAKKEEAKAKPRPSTAKEAAEVFFGPEAVQNEQAIESLRRRGLYVPEDQAPVKSAEESAQAFEAEQARLQGETLRAQAPPERVVQRIGPELGKRIPSVGEMGGGALPEAARAEEELPLFAEPASEIEKIDQQANAAATSPLNDRPQPTEAQKDAGNYAKGHVKLHGLDISIENPRGSERAGTDKAGKPWSVVMEHPYGYIRGTQGRDKDHLDVFIGPDPESPKAFVVDQVNPETGKWDEHKILLGFNTEEEARKGYLDNYQEGWKGLGAITEMPVDEFKAWAKSGPKTKPVAYKEAKNAGEVSGNQRSDVRKEEGGVEKAAPGAGVVLGGEKAPVRREPILGGENLQFTEKTGGEAGERAGLTPEAKPAEGEKKEPWQMTAAEYEETLPMDTRIIPPQRKRQGASIVRLSEDETVTTSEHGKAVFEAIRAGKPVPAEVIAEYPELTKKEEKPAPKPSEKPTFRQFIEAKGIAWPVKTSDPRYKVLKEEYDAVKAIPPAVVETLTEESKEEKAEPAPQPEARGELAPELKSLILMDMKTALEEGHKYGMRDDETVGQGSNQVPIGTTNPPWLMDIIRAMKAKNKQTTGKTEILAVIKKELEGKGDTFSPKQLKLWFIIEDHLREESGKPHYTKAAEIMSGTMETLIDDYNEGADIGQYDDSDLEYPPTEKEIETAAVNVVSEEVANGNQEALQAYQAERGEARREENEAPAATAGPAEEVKPAKAEKVSRVNKDVRAWIRFKENEPDPGNSQTIHSIANHTIRPMLKKMEKSGWVEYRQLGKKGDTWTRSLDNAGLVDKAWDEEGNTYYGLKGTPLREGLMDEAEANRREEAAKPKEEPKAETTQREAFDTLSSIQPGGRASKFVDESRNKVADKFVELGVLEKTPDDRYMILKENTSIRQAAIGEIGRQIKESQKATTTPVDWDKVKEAVAAKPAEEKAPVAEAKELSPEEEAGIDTDFDKEGQEKIEDRGEFPTLFDVEPAKTIAGEDTGKTTPKQQKAFLIDAIDKLIKDAPKGEPVDTKGSRYGKTGPAEQYERQNELRQKYGIVRIEVPDDGTFNIINTKEALEAFKKAAQKFPVSEGVKKAPPLPTLKPSGKRLAEEEVTYYNEFRPRKRGLVLNPVTVNNAGEETNNNLYVDGYFTQGNYLVKTEKPKEKLGDRKPDVKSIINSANQNLQPARIVGEYHLGMDPAREPVKVHIIGKDGKEQVANADFIDTVLTIHPDAELFIKKGSNSKYDSLTPLVFKKGDEVLSIVMPLKYDDKDMPSRVFADRIKEILGTEAPVEKAQPKPKEPKPKKDKGPTRGEVAKELYQPGNIIWIGYWHSYDKVLEVKGIPGEKDWSVKVIRTDKEGNPLPNEGPRWHSTLPDKTDRLERKGEGEEREAKVFRVGDNVEVKTRTGKNEYTWQPGNIVDALNEGKAYEVSIENKARPGLPTTVRINAEDLRVPEKAPAEAEAKPTTEDAGEKGKLKIGDEQRIMGNDAVVAKIETHDGVSYALLNAAKLSDKRGYIRVFDEDSGKVVSVNEFPTYDAAETKYNQTVADAKKVAGGKIEDFGEKVGGARKDTAERGYSMSGKAKKEDEGPAWRKKFVAMEKVHEPGKWVIGMAGAAKSGMMTRFGGQVFSSQEEAEKAIPLYAVAQNHSVYQNDDKTFSIYKRVSDRKSLKVVNKDFPSREEAMKHMALHAEELLNLKTNFGEEILPVPEIAIRKGEERRTKDATPEMFMETFAPRGIEFGNWNNQEERQQVMNHAYDGLLDLADALGLPPKALMLNGELAIAFGARGQGLTGAKAHYETDYGIINLTKMKGAGSLAHEWLHALDHYLGRQDTPERGKRVANKRGDMVFPTTASGKEYATEGLKIKDSGVRTELKEAFETLLQTMYKRAEQYVEDTKQADKFLGKAREHLAGALNNIRGDLSRDLTNYHKSKGGYSNKPIKFFEPASAEQLAEFDRLASILVEGGSLETAWRNNYDPENQEDAAKLEKIKNRKQRLGMIASGRHTNDTLEAINAIIKAARNHQGFNKEQTGSLDKVRAAMGVYKARIKMFEEAEAGTEKTRMRPTSYAIEAKKMDQARTGDYWSEPREMAARAFAAYVEDKIAEKGGQSDFLVYQAHGGFLLPMIDGFVARPYPEGAEREAINKAFDKFISQIQTRETPQGVEMYEVLDQTDTPEFKKWFADSKVVDEAGEPLVLYHGTTQDFSEFKKGDLGFHFGTTPEQSASRIKDFEAYYPYKETVAPGGNIKPVYLSLKNPLRMRDVTNWDFPTFINDELLARGVINQAEHKTLENDTSSTQERIAKTRSMIQSKGYDGIVYLNRHEEAGVSALAQRTLDSDESFKHYHPLAVDSYIAFEPTQIKSATANVGTFSPENPDIRYNVESRDAIRSGATFAEQLDDFAAGKIVNRREPITIGQTPYVLQMLGAEQVPIVITQGVVEKAISKEEGQHGHGISIETLKQLPAQIADPVMVFDSATGKDSLVVMTELRQDGKSIVAAVHLGKERTHYVVNEIASVHPRESNAHFINWINQGLLRYQNKQKSREWFQSGGLQLPKEGAAIRGFKNKILYSHDLVKWIDENIGTKQYNVRDLHRRGLLKPAKLEDVKKFFPGQEVGLDANKNIYVKTRGGKYVTLYRVDHIEPNAVVILAGYGKTKFAPGSVIPGAFGQKSTGGYYIKLHRTFGDTWTLAHESMHFMETAGIINERDVEVLKAHIRNLHRDGRWDPANRKDIGGPEDRANFIADRLAIPEQRGPIGRIILRIRAFIDGILETFGVRSPESILRGIESGRIFDRKGLSAAEKNAMGYAMTSKPGAGEITTKKLPRTPEGEIDFFSPEFQKELKENDSLWLHGATEDISSFSPEGGGYYGGAVYLTKKLGTAEFYGKKGGGTKVIDTSALKLADIENEKTAKQVADRFVDEYTQADSDLYDLVDEIGEAAAKERIASELESLDIVQSGGWLESEYFWKTLRDLGFDGARNSTEAVIDPAKAKILPNPARPPESGGDQYFSVITPELPDLKGERYAPAIIPARLAPMVDSIVQPGILKRAWDELRYQAQDKFLYLNKAQSEAERRAGRELPEAQDAYLAETRYHGMAAAAIEDFDEKHVDPLIELMSENNIDVEQADEYLHARHAKEANARLREINPDREDNQALSGMSDQEAEQILDRINRGPQAQIYKRIGRMVDAITKARRDLLIEAGLETEDTIAKWEKTYQHYVPLMREGKSEAMPRKGRGFEVRGGQKLRAGSTREVVNILANVVAQHEATIVRAEKAKVSRAFLAFAKTNRGPWRIDIPEKVASFDADGLIQYRANPLGYMLAENVLAVRVDGKDHHITFDERDLDGMKILSALKNLDAADMGAVTRAVAKISRWLAVINTSLNPEFIISNFARDIQTAAYNMADNEADAIRMKAIKQVGSAFKGIREYQDNNRDTEWARWFNRFRNAGGQTGWIQSYETIQDREKALISKIEDMKHGKIRSVKRGLTAAFDYIADMNTAVENAIRLSVFKNLIEANVPESKAAKIAKELTVNFNRKGNMGPVLNAFYLFYNASIQGSARLIMAGAKSRKVRKLMGATIVFAAALDIMNRAVGGDDDDGENRYDKIAPWIKDRNMIIMLPGNGGHIQIPLPWGYNIFHVMGQAAGEVLTKKNNKATASALRVGGAIVSAFNPMGGESSLLQMISPTLLDPFVQWAENKDWSGRKLRPSANPYAEKPSSQTYWHSARVPSKWIAKTLNELTGGDEVRPGKIDISPESIDLAIDTVTGGAGKFVSNLISTPIKYAKGEDVETYEIPFLRRVYGKAGKQVLTQEYYENMDSVRLVQRQLSHYKNDPAKVREIAQEYKSEVRLIGRMKATQKAMKDLKDQLKAAEMIKDPDVRKAREKKIEETMEKIMTGFNKNYNLMKNRED